MALKLLLSVVAFGSTNVPEPGEKLMVTVSVAAPFPSPMVVDENGASWPPSATRWLATVPVIVGDGKELELTTDVLELEASFPEASDRAIVKSVVTDCPFSNVYTVGVNTGVAQDICKLAG